MGIVILVLFCVDFGNTEWVLLDPFGFVDAKPCLLQNPSWVLQNSNRPSDICNNMRFLGAPAQVFFVGMLYWFFAF
jgi:hypothetical protein